MSKCDNCAFWSKELGWCGCADLDKWRDCPLEAGKIEYQKALRELAKPTINECLEKLENMLNCCHETMQEEELTLLYERLHITIEEAKEKGVRK